jgi:hypothetical protein
MKKIFKAISIVGIMLLIIYNVTMFHNIEKISEVNLKLLNNIAIADIEWDNVAQCLLNYTYQYNTYPNQKGRCYRDVIGPDIFEGYIIECPSGGWNGCQPTFCRAGQPCYQT